MKALLCILYKVQPKRAVHPEFMKIRIKINAEDWKYTTTEMNRVRSHIQSSAVLSNLHILHD